MTEIVEQSLVERLRAARVAAARVVARAEEVIAAGAWLVAGLNVDEVPVAVVGSKRVYRVVARASDGVECGGNTSARELKRAAIRAEVDALGEKWVPATWGMAAAVRRYRLGGDRSVEAVSVDSVLSVFRDREVLAAMAPVQRAKLAAAAKTARRLKAAYWKLVCSEAWYQTLVRDRGVPCYPPAADTASCRMRRVRDLDHLGDQLQPGQSRTRLYPAVYVTAAGYSMDAVIEATEIRRMRLNASHDRPEKPRAALYAARDRDGSYR